MNARKLRLESLEERTLLTVTAGGFELTAAFPEPVSATNWIVNTTDDATDWDETDDILSLREAIGRAQTSDTLTVDDSLAGSTITLCGIELSVNKGITVDATSIGGITIDANGQSRVLYVSGGYETNPVELIDLTITGGWLYNDDGAICNGGTLKLTNVTVTGNTAAFYGGGIYNYGTLILTNTIVAENSAGFGGGIYNGEGTLELTDSTVLGNTAYSGAGIFNDFGTLTLTNSTISGNTASWDGGGIYNNDYSTLTLTDSTISGNIANVSGGGIYNANNMTITNSAVSGNTASCDGGGSYNSGTLTMTNCAISGNTASGSDSSSGGGVYDKGMLTLTNCTVSGNAASFGGGIYDEGHSDICDTIFENAIIAQNSADTYGDDIYIASATIYAYNTLSSTSFWSLSAHCLLYDPAKPLFTDSANGDYTLAENSQAIDKGNNEYVETEIDLVGNPRIVGGIVDIGAYEYQSGGGQTEPLIAPSITTGSNRVYVSYGANRHQIQWSAVENASGYELAYSADGNSWTSVFAAGTSAVVTGLTYGAAMQYRVRALGTGSYTDSDWSAVKTFSVCPMDINGDGDISGGDRTLLGNSWLAEEGEDEFRYYCDITGDGDIGGADRVYLSNNWLLNVEDDADDLQYPLAKASDAVFAEFASADLDTDLGVF